MGEDKQNEGQLKHSESRQSSSQICKQEKNDSRRRTNVGCNFHLNWSLIEEESLRENVESYH
jgi:hypothetical protein